jgi:hypothetical protein
VYICTSCEERVRIVGPRPEQGAEAS